MRFGCAAGAFWKGEEGDFSEEDFSEEDGGRVLEYFFNSESFLRVRGKIHYGFALIIWLSELC